MKQCPCPMPPGGQVSCDDHQVAICRVVGGVPHGECLTPPQQHKTRFSMTGDPDPLYRWALERITGRPHGKVSYKDVDTLRSGGYVDPLSGEEVTFKLPDYFFSSGQTSSTV
jgi:hypothetical protein